MTEIIEPGVLNHKPHRKIKLLDVIIFVVVIAILAFLAVTLTRSLTLKNEVAAARTVSDKVIADIARQDAEGAYKLGDSNFQSKNSVTQLKQVFTNVSQLASGSPGVVKRTVANTHKQDAVYIIYKYSSKTPYYIRVGTAKESGKWYLANLSGSTNQANLIVK